MNRTPLLRFAVFTGSILFGCLAMLFKLACFVVGEQRLKELVIEGMNDAELRDEWVRLGGAAAMVNMDSAVQKLRSNQEQQDVGL